jgi:branched-chain amino acid aminotransferase
MIWNIAVERTKKSCLAQIDFDNIPFGKAISDHMFMVDFDGENWIDPRIVPYGNMELAPSNLALHYGQSIFEGMKATKFDGVPYLFRPEMHVERLNKSAKRMCMPELPGELFIQALEMLLRLDSAFIPEKEGHALYIRPFMFATDEVFGVHVSKNYRFMIFTGPVGPYYPKPVKLITETKYARAAHGGVGEAKAAGNYGAAMYPTERARRKGYDNVMWLDDRDFKYIQEVGTMNLFFVIDGVVVTPSTPGTILKGITRDSFLIYLKSKGYKVEERLISIEELVDAHHRGLLQEAFGAGTAAVVSHIIEITHNDEHLMLPDVSERKVGTMLKNWLDGLRSGRLDDDFGWLHPVLPENEAVFAKNGHAKHVVVAI